MKRFYLCPVIGDGSEENPFRPAVAEYDVQWSCAIASGEDGRPLQAMCVVEVGADDHAALQADPAFTDITAEQ